MTGKHRVILIRHVKTEYNETKRISGQADIAILQDTALEFIDDLTLSEARVYVRSEDVV